MFEKIIERLEEEVKYQNEQAAEEPPFCELTFEEARRKMAECYEHAIEIVNQVAEEFGNPERVDVPDINVGDNGFLINGKELLEELNDNLKIVRSVHKRTMDDIWAMACSTLITTIEEIEAMPKIMLSARKNGWIPCSSGKLPEKQVGILLRTKEAI